MWISVGEVSKAARFSKLNLGTNTVSLHSPAHVYDLEF